MTAYPLQSGKSACAHRLSAYDKHRAILSALRNLLWAEIAQHCSEISGNAPPLFVARHCRPSSTPHARDVRAEPTPICEDESAFHMHDAFTVHVIKVACWVSVRICARLEQGQGEGPRK
eukprot:30329-Pyramimonas_sp.AAC.2